MLALQVIDSQVLRDTLLTIPEVLALVQLGTSGQYKIFWEHVPDKTPLPYIVMTHMVGGRGNGTTTSRHYSDTMWKIAGHTGDIDTAKAFANAISKLEDICPVCTAYADVSGVTTIHEVLPLMDRYQVQNAPLFVVGGMYRLQLNLGAN